jgi:RHS repeat-associated protein
VLFARVASVTDSSGYTVEMTYDAMNRPTEVTYPDNTTEEFEYNRFDLVLARDRTGRATRSFYNALGQRVAVQDPLGRMTQYNWCKCGSLNSLIDGKGQVTRWQYDVQSRTTKKIFADNSEMLYAYENTTSRMKTVTDAEDQKTHYTYYDDNNVEEVSYTDVAVATHEVNYTYDSVYNRVLTMIDGVGTTSYSYNPITLTPTNGAGRLVLVNGPWADSQVLYSYDELGRVVGRAVDSVAQTVEYDSLGRVKEIENSLGTFDYHYVAQTGRLDSIDLPNGQTTEFNYHNTAGDLRLEEIKHLNSSPATISKFNYTYNPVGQIQTWTQQVGSGTADVHAMAYDAADQLTQDTISASSTVTKRYGYTYDKAGNRTGEQLGDPPSTDQTSKTSTYNNLNQLTGQSYGGPTAFKGTVSELADVTVAGQAASVGTNLTFRANVALTTGTNTVQIVAKDGSNNSRTNNFEVVMGTGSGGSFTYDDNGNLINDGSKTYEWDGAQRLTKINYGSTSTEFTYDGLSRRVKIVEKNGSTPTSTKKFVWVGSEIVEERDGSNDTIKRFYGQGVKVVGASSPDDKLYYTRDHLGSVRELTDSTQAPRARYDYDPYGRMTKVSGDLDADFGYTGHYFHEPSELNLTLYRAFNSKVGIWISRDPLINSEIILGTGLYQYVKNNPVNLWDPFGLRDYSEAETRLILDDATRDSRGLLGMWHMLLNHRGNGRFDFKSTQPYDTFCVNGRQLKPDQFGNYIAGYAAAQQDGATSFMAPVALPLVRGAGVMFDFADSVKNRLGIGFDDGNVFDWDADSVPDINKGYQDGGRRWYDDPPPGLFE